MDLRHFTILEAISVSAVGSMLLRRIPTCRLGSHDSSPTGIIRKNRIPCCTCLKLFILGLIPIAWVFSILFCNEDQRLNSDWGDSCHAALDYKYPVECDNLGRFV